MRIETHEIDTQARKIAPIALPRQWEYRNVTGRDYGIDMEVEIFEKKKATGQILLFQIKGTERDIIFKDGKSSFDDTTKTLQYSERFVTPFILAVCPINSGNQHFYYIWIQEYINSVLNFNNPEWRQNTTTTSISLLEENVMPGNEDKFTFISHFPQRLYGACDVARILHNLKYTLDGEPRLSAYKEVAEELQEILKKQGFLSDQWRVGEFIQKQYLQPAMLAARLIADQKEPEEEEIKLLPFFSSKVVDSFGSKKEGALFMLKGQVSHGLNCMSFFYEETNYSLKNFFWNEEGGHSF